MFRHFFLKTKDAMFGRVPLSVLHPPLLCTSPRAFLHSSGPPLRFKGLLKQVGYKEKQNGYDSVDGPFLTRLVKRAKSSKQVRQLLTEAHQRFRGKPPWEFLAAAAHVSANLNDPELAGCLLFRIPPENFPDVHERVIRAVLGKASHKEVSGVALKAFNFLVAKGVPLIPTDYARVIHSGLNSLAKETRLIRQLLKQPSPPHLDHRVLGVLLKACSARHPFDRAREVWNWAAPRRLAPSYGTDHDQRYGNAQYLLICARAGEIGEAREVWEAAKKANIARMPIITGSMLAILAAHGSAEELRTFIKDMAPFSLNTRILNAALTSLSHSGDVLAARALMDRIEAENTAPRLPDTRTYTALVDVYARSGDFKSALATIEHAKSQENFKESGVVWMAVLGSCRHFKNLPVAQEAFDAVKRLGPPEELVSAYALMSDVYKACGDESAASDLDQECLDKGLTKESSATTLLMANGTKHVFHTREIPPKLSRASKAIHKKLKEWSVWLAVHGVSDESIQGQHSEKLALAYAVTQGIRHVVLRKESRMRRPCHEASKQITALEAISIHHWYKSNLHDIRDGECSCNDKH